jgi:hypothetical protein
MKPKYFRHTPKVPTPEPVSILDTVSIFDTMTTDDSSEIDSETEASSTARLYSSKPRNLVQRRATITGGSPTIKHSFDIEQFWKKLKQKHDTTFQLLDKAASCIHGLENMQEISRNLKSETYFGIEQRSIKKETVTKDNSKKVQPAQTMFNIRNTVNSKQCDTADNGKQLNDFNLIHSCIKDYIIVLYTLF